MSAPLRDRLLASSVNGGGLFHVDECGVRRLSVIDTSGIAATPAGLLLARQSDLSNELRRYAQAGWTRHEVAPHVLDLHDVLWHDGRVLAVATEINAVLELDPADLREIRRWTMAGEPDSSHVNSLCVHRGRLLASRFGNFPTHRGYKGATRGAGEVFDVESGEVVIAGLSQPHSLTAHGAALWLCDSEARTLRCYEDFVETRSVVLDGYVRGLAFGHDAIYVGLSCSRNAPDSGPGHARILRLDPTDLAVLGEVALPTNEVYDLRVVDAPIQELQAAAFEESLAEIERQRRAAVSSDRSAHEAHDHARWLADKLHQANLRIASCERELAESAARDQASGWRDEEEATWARLLHDEVARLRAVEAHRQSTIDAQRRLLAEAADALAAKDRHLAAITQSRWWRYGRPFRGDPGTAPATPDLVTGAIEPGEAPLPLKAGQLPTGIDAGPRRGAVPILELAFEAPAAPRVSVVVTAYGCYAQTLACLRSLQASGDAAPFEVILAEDASGDPEMERFAGVPGLRYVANPGNLGFLASANNAAGLARGEFVAFLNNDTTVVPGWLDALLSTFAIFHECGIAGARLVYPDGRLQEAGGIVWSDGSGCNYGRDGDPGDPEHAVVREVDYVSGAAMMLRTRVFQDLGGFDPRYAPAYYEDTDLAFRVREAGLRVYYQPAATVVHVEGLSHGTDVGSGGKSNQARNRQVFLERWRDVLERDQWRPGEHAFLARDRAQRKPTVLVVDHRAPEPDHDAGSRAIWHLLRVLQLRGFSIKFWACEGSEDARYPLNLRVHGFEPLDEARNGPPGAWLETNGGYLDYVILSRPMVAAAMLADVRRHSGARVVYYGHDIHHLRLQGQFEVSGEAWLPPHIAHVRDVEHALWHGTDLVLYPTDEETRCVREWLAGEGGDAAARAETIPLFAYEASYEPVAAPDVRREVLFVGSFQHAPNEDGACWFATEVWPLVRAARPDLRLVLVGAAASERLLGLAADDVELAGYVSDAVLTSRYEAARVVVAPLRFGAGLKGKVLEALRHGVPCVATPVGAQGLEASAFLRVADDPAGFAGHVLALAEGDGAWRQAQAEAQAYVVRRFSAHALWEVLASVMDPTPYPDVDARRRRIKANRGASADRGGAHG